MSRSDDNPTEPEDPLTPEERAVRYARARKAYESLLSFQRASPRRLAEFQERNARSLIAHARKHAPFYRERLQALDDGIGGIDMRRWLEVPVLTREEVVEHGRSQWAESLPPEHSRTRMATSSGTGGQRVEVRRSELQNTINGCLQWRYWHDCGLDFSRPLCFVRATDPNGAIGAPELLAEEARRWGPQWLPLKKRGLRHIVPVHAPPEMQIDRLEQLAPAYVHTTPSNLLALAHHIRDHGANFPAVEKLLTGGEPLTADILKQTERWIGAPVYDAFATGECGTIATRCPEASGYHINAETAVVEILKESGQPCVAGETGFLTVTPLYAYAQPLVRYRTGDWVTAGGQCECGRTLPLIAEIVGRERSLLRFADGTRSRLEPDSDRMFELIGRRRWQIAQTSKASIEVRIAEMPAAQPADFEATAAYIGELTGGIVQVQCTMVPALGLASSGKFQRVVREFE